MSSVAAVEAWSTFALAILALIGAWYARGQVGEARAIRKAAGRAYVVIDAQGDKPTRAINLVLANAGQSHAENVTVRFQPPLEAASTAIDHVETAAVWNQPVMPPGKRIRTVLDVGPDRADSDLPMEYHAVVRYDSRRPTKLASSTPIASISSHLSTRSGSGILSISTRRNRRGRWSQ